MDADAASLPAPTLSSSTARRWLRWSGRLWFICATLGLWMFAFYVAALYLPLLMAQGAPGLAQTHLPNGYVQGDTPGNSSIVAHLLLSIVVIAAGPLQLIPWVRTRFPRFHRWNGRLWIGLSVATSVSGMYLTWTREPLVGGLNGQVGTSIGGLLILIFSTITVYAARNRKMAEHRRWAFRLFMVVSVVWFFRIGYKFWAVAANGQYVHEFFAFWYHGQYLVPLGALQLYLWAERNRSSSAKLAVALVTALMTLLMSIGIFAAVTQMWLPRL